MKNRYNVIVHRYGYKVCYRENRKGIYIRYFITYTYKQALISISYYVSYPQRSRTDNHLLCNPEWKIFPISKKEVKDGIWRDIPF